MLKLLALFDRDFICILVVDVVVILAVVGAVTVARWILDF